MTWVCGSEHGRSKSLALSTKGEHDLVSFQPHLTLNDPGPLARTSIVISVDYHGLGARECTQDEECNRIKHQASTGGPREYAILHCVRRM